MAKETMQAVSEAERSARETVLHAKEESETLQRETEERARQLLVNAEKEALKKTEVLCGVARADAEKLLARSRQETEQEQERLKKAAESAAPAAADEIRKIVLGQGGQ